MPRVFSSIAIAVGAASLALSVPAAAGMTIARSQDPEPLGAAYSDAHERGVLSQGVEPGVAAYRDAASRVQPRPAVFTYRDQRTGIVRPLYDPTPTVLTDSHERSTPSTPTVPPGRIDSVSVGTGWGIEWLQVGIGLGVGILLGLTVVLAVRATRMGPLAH